MYLGNMVCISGGCGAAMTASTILWKIKFTDYKLLLKIKAAFYRSHARIAILHGREICFLKENEIGIMRTERSTVKAICEVQLKEKNYGLEAHDEFEGNYELDGYGKQCAVV